MQLEGHGSYWKAKILEIQEFWLLRLLLKKNVFFDRNYPAWPYIINPQIGISHEIGTYIWTEYTSDYLYLQS